MYSITKLSHVTFVKHTTVSASPQTRRRTETTKCSIHHFVTWLLLIEAGHLLPDVLIRGVQGSVDFLQADKMISNTESVEAPSDLK